MNIYFADDFTISSSFGDNKEILDFWDFTKELSKEPNYKNKSLIFELDELFFFIPIVEQKIAFYRINFSLPYGLYGGVFSSQPASSINYDKRFLKKINQKLKSFLVIQSLDMEDVIEFSAFHKILVTYTQRLNLKGKDYDDIFKNVFDPKLRNQIRKAEKCGVIENNKKDSKILNDFFTLYCKSNLRWGKNKVKYTKEFFNRFLKKRYVDFRIAYLDDTAIAGIILLKIGNSVQYWFGAMDKEFSKFCPNHLLLSNAIKEAAAESKQFFDFSTSGIHNRLKSVVKFKASFGTTIETYCVYCSSSITKAWLLRKYLGIRKK